MRKILSLTAILVFALLVTACGSEEKRTSPADDVNVLCKAFLQGDEASLKKIGMTPEQYEKQFILEFSKSFTESSGMNFTSEQIVKVNDAMRSLLARSTCETAVVSENGDDATVKVTVSTLSQLDEAAFMSKLPENILTMSDAERVDAFANVFAEFLKDMSYSGTKEFNVECKYDAQEKMWLPVDVENFGNTLAENVFGM